MMKRYGTRNRRFRAASCFLTVLLLFGLVMPVHNTAMATELDTVEETKEDGMLPTNTLGETTSPGTRYDADTALSVMAAGNSVLADDISILADATTEIEVLNYFDASGNQSTNGRYIAKGVYVDLKGKAHILLYLVNNNQPQPIITASINDITIKNPEFVSLGSNASFYFKENDTRTHITTIGKDYEEKSLKVELVIDLEIGDASNLKQLNTLSVDTPTGSGSVPGGWDILDMEIEIDIDYSIIKKVEPNIATIGEELLYTITVSNLGDFRLVGMNVYDDVPDGITIIGVSGDNKQWQEPTYSISGDGAVILEENLILGNKSSDTKSKTYYIKAMVDDDVEDGDKIKNTAFTGGSVPRKEATAEVEIYSVDVTIYKFITGNFGNLTKRFHFTLIANKDQSFNEEYSFDLSHGESKSFSNLPAHTVLTLTEESGGYDVTVKVGATEVTPNDTGAYIITLFDEDIDIIVTNHKYIDIDTGISLDSLPYIIILAIVIAGIVIIFMRKYKVNRED